MHKLYAHFILLFFILICSTRTAHGMETTVSQPHTTTIQHVPSLETLCIQYIGKNAQQVNLLDNLYTMPAQLAEKTISCTNYPYLGTHQRKLIDMAKSNNLNPRTACAIASKLMHVKLAYTLAKRDAITNNAAAFIVFHFIRRMDITTCLNNFERIYKTTFPEKILQHGNYGRLHQQLMHLMTRDVYTFTCIEDTNALFSIEDFEQNFSTVEIKRFLMNKLIGTSWEKACLHGLITLSPCEQFIAFPDDNETIRLGNLKTKMELKINLFGKLSSNPCKFIFNQDYSQLGILCENNQIFIVEVPITLLGNTLSLQDLVALTYCKEKLNEQIPTTFEDQQLAIEHIVFEDEQDAYTLSTFITENDTIYSFLHNFSCESLSVLEHAVNWSYFLTLMADALHMTKAEIAVRLAEDDPLFINQTIEILKQEGDLLDVTFFDQPAQDFFLDRIAPIAKRLR